MVQNTLHWCIFELGAHHSVICVFRHSLFRYITNNYYHITARFLISIIVYLLLYNS